MVAVVAVFETLILLIDFLLKSICSYGLELQPCEVAVAR
jgi:hypothetical protein